MTCYKVTLVKNYLLQGHPCQKWPVTRSPLSRISCYQVTLVKRTCYKDTLVKNFLRPLKSSMTCYNVTWPPCRYSNDLYQSRTCQDWIDWMTCNKAPGQEWPLKSPPMSKVTYVLWNTVAKILSMNRNTLSSWQTVQFWILSKHHSWGTIFLANTIFWGTILLASSKLASFSNYISKKQHSLSFKHHSILETYF